MLVIVAIVLVSLVLVTWMWRHVMLSATLRDDPHLHADADAEAPANAPKLSVLIPARNEAHNIVRALDTVLAQDYPDFEVIVADDRSDDDTRTIVRTVAESDPRVGLVTCDQLPDGWTGKNHALWCAQKEARGELLLFLDADVALDPGAINVMVNALLEGRLDMLSLLLRVDSRSFWEKSIRVLVGSMLMLRFPLRKVNDPSSSVAFANGQAILIRREVYDAVGSHESIRSILLEDIALARRVKQDGHRLCAAYGFDMAAARMYASLADIWRGWSRIFYSAFEGSLPKLLVGVLLLAVFTLLPYFALVYAAALLLSGVAPAAPTALLVLSLMQITVMLSLMVRMHRMTRCEAGYVVMHFPAALLAMGILFTSISRKFSRRGIAWKGTRYDTRGDHV